MKLTQEDFGNLFDPPASKGIVSKWESNKTVPSTDRLVDISNWSGKPIDELLYGSLRGAIIKIIDDVDKYWDELLDSPSEEAFIEKNAKDNKIETISYLQNVYYFLRFINSDYYGNPKPQYWKNRTLDYKETDDDIKELNEFQHKEFVTSRRYILDNSLKIAKTTGIKPYQTKALVKIIRDEAERHFNSFTRDNEGMINVASIGLEQVAQDLYSLVGHDLKNDNLISSDKIDPNLYEKINSILENTQDEISDLRDEFNIPY